ncbi:MAG: DciA family protein [Candidatus Nanopelagicales bacterium]
MSTDPALAALARVRMATSNRAKERYRPVVSPTLSSAVPDDRDPQLLGRCVDTWVRGNGYGHEIAVAGLADRWQAIVGPQVADHVSVQGFNPGAPRWRADHRGRRGRVGGAAEVPRAQDPTTHR